MKQLLTYSDFNEASGAEVKRLSLGSEPIVGNCRYSSGNNSIFLLPDAVLSFVVSGKKYMLVNRQEYYLQRGDLIYLPPNSATFTQITKTEENFESINILLKSSLLKDLTSPDNSEAVSLGVMPFCWKNSEEITELFEKFWQMMRLADIPVKEQDHKYLLKELLKLCAENIFEKRQRKPLRQKDVEMMTKALSSNIYSYNNLDEMAGRSNMSLATFKRKFEQAFGEPPKTWIRNTCLQTAFFQLKTKAFSVAEASDYIGFDNLSHFSQAFKKYFHISPSELCHKN